MYTISPLKDPGIFEVATLSNGIRIFHRQCEQLFGLPKVAGSVLVMVGGRDDPKGHEGMAHFFEHMPFRGTKDFPSLLELTHPIEANGGYINAFTTDEATGYEVVVPTELLKDAVARLADMMRYPSLKTEDIEIERGVIQEELRNKLSNVNFFARQHLYQGLLNDHPIASAVIGTEAALDSITKDDLATFHATYYNARNTSLFFSGNYDPNELLALCEDYFGQLATGVATERNYPVAISSQSTYTQTYTPTNYNRSVYLLGRVLPQLDVASMTKLSLFTSMLVRGMNSPLHSEIREKRGLAYSMNLSFHAFQDVALLLFGVSTQYKSMDEVDRIFWEEASKILENKERFEEVKHMALQSTLHREFTIPSLVDGAIDLFMDHKRIIPLQEAIAILHGITLHDVRTFMVPYLTKNEYLNIRVNCDH